MSLLPAQFATALVKVTFTSAFRKLRWQRGQSFTSVHLQWLKSNFYQRIYALGKVIFASAFHFMLAKVLIPTLICQPPFANTSQVNSILPAQYQLLPAQKCAGKSDISCSWTGGHGSC